MILVHYLQGYYISEISRSQQNLGNHHLHPHFSNCIPVPLQLPQYRIYSPKDIVTHIKESADHQPATTTETTSIVDNHVEVGINNLSTTERARCVLDEGRIIVDTKLHTIMSTSCPHLVTLFPKETCTCSSTKQSYRILAANLQ